MEYQKNIKFRIAMNKKKENSLADLSRESNPGCIRIKCNIKIDALYKFNYYFFYVKFQHRFLNSGIEPKRSWKCKKKY